MDSQTSSEAQDSLETGTVDETQGAFPEDVGLALIRCDIYLGHMINQRALYGFANTKDTDLALEAANFAMLTAKKLAVNKDDSMQESSSSGKAILVSRATFSLALVYFYRGEVRSARNWFKETAKYGGENASLIDDWLAECDRGPPEKEANYYLPPDVEDVEDEGRA